MANDGGGGSCRVRPPACDQQGCLRHLTARMIRLIGRVVPARLSTVLGVTAIVTLLALIYSNFLVTGFFSAANAMYAPRNDTNKPGVTGPPTSALRSGGPGSNVSWDSWVAKVARSSPRVRRLRICRRHRLASLRLSESGFTQV